MQQMKLKFWAMFDIDGAFTHVNQDSVKFIEESKKIASNKLMSNLMTSQFYSMEHKMNSRNDLSKSVKMIRGGGGKDKSANEHYVQDLYLNDQYSKK